MVVGAHSPTLLLCLFPEAPDSRAYRTALEAVFPRQAVPGHDTDERLAVDELGITALWCAMHVGYRMSALKKLYKLSRVQSALFTSVSSTFHFAQIAAN